MNTLSWIIYLADVVNGFNIMFRLLTAASIIVGIGGWIITSINLGCTYTHRNKESSEYQKSMRKSFSKTIILGVVCSFVLVVVPAKTTLYMIAASEMTEEALELPEMKKLRVILNGKLHEVVDGLQKR